jgi:hypothetical protein
MFSSSAGNLRYYPVGAIIRVASGWGPYHYGIVAEPTLGTQTVVHNTKGKGVQHTTLDEFSDGRPIEVRRIPRSYGDGDTVLRRAKSQIGKPYDLFSANCEHFVNWAIEGTPGSEQLAFVAVASLVIGGVILATRQ